MLPEGETGWAEALGTPPESLTAGVSASHRSLAVQNQRGKLRPPWAEWPKPKSTHISCSLSSPRAPWKEPQGGQDPHLANSSRRPCSGRSRPGSGQAHTASCSPQTPGDTAAVGTVLGGKAEKLGARLPWLLKTQLPILRTSHRHGQLAHCPGGGGPTPQREP